MIFFFIILIAIFVLVLRAAKSKKNIKISCLIIVLINLFFIVFSRFLWPGVTHYAELIFSFWIILIVNFVLLLILFISKIKLNLKLMIIILAVFFLLMLFTPVYKFENHEHTIINGHEAIRSYTEYYNCYGIKLREINNSQNIYNYNIILK